MKEEKKKIGRPGRKVAQIGRDGKLIKVYDSASQAEIENNLGKHVVEVCRGKRKSTGGYYWKFLDEMNNKK